MTNKAADPQGPQAKLDEKIRIGKGDDDRTRQCKRLTFVVRRGVARYGLDADTDGYINMSDVLNVKIEETPVFEKVQEEQLWSLAHEFNKEKKRYEFKEANGKKFIKPAPKAAPKKETEEEKEKRKSFKGKSKGAKQDAEVSEEQLAKAVEDFLKVTPLDDMARERLMRLEPKARLAVVSGFKPKVSLEKTADLSRMFCAFCKKYSGEPATPVARAMVQPVVQPVTLSLDAATTPNKSLNKEAPEFKPMDAATQKMFAAQAEQMYMMQMSMLQAQAQPQWGGFMPPARTAAKGKKGGGKAQKTDGSGKKTEEA